MLVSHKSYHTKPRLSLKSAAFFALLCLAFIAPFNGKATVLTPEESYAANFHPMQGGVSFQIFYDQLSPYGHWFRHPRYGYAWVPSGVNEFNPYVTGGHWVYTDFGWTWVSDYDWGWAPFHYGRWFEDPEFGWTWIPDYDWAPAWVSWGSYGGYYGWAPFPPGISMNMYYGGYRPEARYWTFCDRGHFNDEHVYRYGIRNNAMANNYYNHVTIINNYHQGEGGHRYAGGPRREEVEQAQHTRITPAHFENSNSAGRTRAENGKVIMYRPTIVGSTHATAAPKKVEPAENIKTIRAQESHNAINATKPGSTMQPNNGVRTTAPAPKNTTEPVFSKPQNNQPANKAPAPRDAAPQQNNTAPKENPANNGRPQIEKPQNNPNNQNRPQYNPNLQDRPQTNPNNQIRPQYNPNLQDRPQNNPNNPNRSQVNPNTENRLQTNPNGQSRPQYNSNPQVRPQNNPNNPNRPQAQTLPQSHPQTVAPRGNNTPPPAQHEQVSPRHEEKPVDRPR